MATNDDGLPIGYELFKGNKAEVTTLCEALEKWKDLFTIDSVCFVGDRAMFTEKNLSLLESRGYHYVIAAKLRALPDQLAKKILDKKNYTPHTYKKDQILLGEFTHKGRRVIASYKQKRALNDAKQRDKIIEKIKKQLSSSTSPKKLLNNSGVKKYTTTSSGSSIMLDENKIQADAAWDGMHGVVTNLPDKNPLDILGYYARLWLIEDAFRVNKHTLKIRPIYHWKPKRIHAHIALCYMSFSVLKHLEYRVSLTQRISVQDILDELLGIQASIYEHKVTKDRYRVPGKITQKATKIYKAFRKVRSPDAEPYLT